MPAPHSGRRRGALLLLLALVAPAALGAQRGRAAAPVADVVYEVAFDSARASRRSVGVTMTFTAHDDRPVVLSLPAWTPGSYELRYFARWVSDFAATDDAGRALAWEKADVDSWRVRPLGPGRVRVRFDYRADSLDNAMAWSRADFLMFNGTNLFLYPEGQPLDRYPATVRVATEPGWRVATGMAPGAAPNEFAERSYDDLVDMPFFVGRFAIDSVEVSGRWTRLATYPAGSVSGARREAALDWLRRLIPPQVAVFGEVPWRSYTVLQIVDPGFGGASGLEHQNSHVDVVASGALDDPFLPGLYAHEIFHAFNVKRLRPSDLVPYRYDAAQPTPLLWVSEGVTDYYADLARVRGGVIGADEFYAATTAKIVAVADADPVSLEDASRATWARPADRAAFVYYDKGSLAGLLFDVLIRDASDNARSLDTVMRELYERTYKRGGRGFTTEQFLAAARRAAGGRDFGEVYRRYVSGRDPYPWAEVLPLAGMRLTADTTRAVRLGLTTLPDSSGGVQVVSVVARGAADAAGVRLGDRLVTVGEVAVRDAGFAEAVNRRYAGRAPVAVPLVVRRDGRTLTLPATLGVAVTVARRVLPDPAASPSAARIRAGILAGAAAGPGREARAAAGAQRAGDTTAQRSSSSGSDAP
jgi:predicted metalloprotease with PDZ domain